MPRRRISMTMIIMIRIKMIVPTEMYMAGSLLLSLSEIGFCTAESQGPDDGLHRSGLLRRPLGIERWLLCRKLPFARGTSERSRKATLLDRRRVLIYPSCHPANQHRALAVGLPIARSGTRQRSAVWQALTAMLSRCGSHWSQPIHLHAVTVGAMPLSVDCRPTSEPNGDVFAPHRSARDRVLPQDLR